MQPYWECTGRWLWLRKEVDFLKNKSVVFILKRDEILALPLKEGEGVLWIRDKIKELDMALVDMPVWLEAMKTRNCIPETEKGYMRLFEKWHSPYNIADIYDVARYCNVLTNRMHMLRICSGSVLAMLWQRPTYSEDQCASTNVVPVVKNAKPLSADAKARFFDNQNVVEEAHALSSEEPEAVDEITVETPAETKSRIHEAVEEWLENTSIGPLPGKVIMSHESDDLQREMAEWDETVKGASLQLRKSTSRPNPRSDKLTHISRPSTWPMGDPSTELSVPPRPKSVEAPDVGEEQTLALIERWEVLNRLTTSGAHSHQEEYQILTMEGPSEPAYADISHATKSDTHGRQGIQSSGLVWDTTSDRKERPVIVDVLEHPRLAEGQTLHITREEIYYQDLFCLHRLLKQSQIPAGDTHLPIEVLSRMTKDIKRRLRRVERTAKTYVEYNRLRDLQSLVTLQPFARYDESTREVMFCPHSDTAGLLNYYEQVAEYATSL